jgi:predicted phosphodiesterase
MKVAVISDVHSNLVALEAVLAALGSVDAVWHLGDAVGYGPKPQAVVDRLRGAGAVWVRGNHDDAAAGGRGIELFNPDGYEAMVWTREHIDDATRAFLAALPERETPQGSRFTLVHGSPTDPIWEYLHSAATATRNMFAYDTPFCLAGHTHVPAAFRQSGESMKPVGVKSGTRLTLGEKRLILNPGSVGQPRDGDARAAYMVIDTDAGHVIWHRVAYDFVATQIAMARAGLPHDLARRLTVGR